MKYVNVKTGIVVEVECEISGGPWEPAEKPETKGKPKEKALSGRKKK